MGVAGKSQQRAVLQQQQRGKAWHRARPSALLSMHRFAMVWWEGAGKTRKISTGMIGTAVGGRRGNKEDIHGNDRNSNGNNHNCKGNLQMSGN